MSDTRLIFALNRKVSTNGVKIRDFVYSNGYGLHIYKGKSYGVEEFNAISQSVFSKHADLFPFAKVVSEVPSIEILCVGSMAHLRGYAPGNEPVTPGVPPDRSPDEVAKAVEVLNAVDAILGTWPGVNEEPISANVRRLIEENAAQAATIAKLEADESAPAVHHADNPERVKRKYVRRETVASLAKASAALAAAAA